MNTITSRLLSIKPLFLTSIMFVLIFSLGIATNADAQKMYMANFGNSTVSQANLDGSGGVSLGNLNGTLSLPVGIALDLPTPSSESAIVPTMNEWGMIIFMVIAGFISVYYLYARRKDIKA